MRVLKKIRKLDIFIIIISLALAIAFIFVIAFMQVEANNEIKPVANPSEEQTPSQEEINSSDNNTTDTSSQEQKSEAIKSVNASSFNEADIKILDDIMKKHGDGVSAYYLDIDSNNTYAYNENEKYFIASVIKAPFSMYIYKLASEGKCDLSTTITMKEENKQTGMGKLKDMEAPKDFTISELIHYAITESDNTAMKLLVKHFSYDGFTEFAKQIGIENIEDVKHVDNGDICAKDAAVYANAIYEFIEENEYGEALKKEMMATKNPMIRSKYPIARKYGWAEKSLHDMAIVYAPHPYVLAICTNKDQGTAEDMSLFNELTKAIEKLQAKKYKNAE